MLIRSLERTYRDLHLAEYVPHDKFHVKFRLPFRMTTEEYRDSTPGLLDLKRAGCRVLA